MPTAAGTRLIQYRLHDAVNGRLEPAKSRMGQQLESSDNGKRILSQILLGIRNLEY